MALLATEITVARFSLLRLHPVRESVKDIQNEVSLAPKVASLRYGRNLILFSHNSPMYDECQTQSAKALSLP